MESSAAIRSTSASLSNTNAKVPKVVNCFPSAQEMASQARVEKESKEETLFSEMISVKGRCGYCVRVFKNENEKMQFGIYKSYCHKETSEWRLITWSAAIMDPSLLQPTIEALNKVSQSLPVAVAKASQGNHWIHIIFVCFLNFSLYLIFILFFSIIVCVQ